MTDFNIDERDRRVGMKGHLRALVFLLFITLLSTVPVIAEKDTGSERLGGPGASGGTFGPIEIGSDLEFNATNGVTSGSGTADDPYIIGPWYILLEGQVFGIRVHDTTAHFNVIDCIIERSDATLDLHPCGIYMFNSTRGHITHCSITGLDEGVHIEGAENVSIQNSFILDCAYGIYAYDCMDLIVVSNELADCDSGIGIFCTERSRIERNTVLNTYYHGIVLESNVNSLIANNTVIAAQIYYGPQSSGIWLNQGNTNCSVTRNICSNTYGCGICIGPQYSDQPINHEIFVSYNNCSRNNCGINSQFNPYPVIIENNILLNNTRGITTYRSVNIIRNNTIFGNYDGILTNNQYESLIEHNHLADNVKGIFIGEGSREQTIVNNLFERNDIGIEVNQYWTNSDSTIINNSFQDNGISIEVWKGKDYEIINNIFSGGSNTIVLDNVRSYLICNNLFEKNDVLLMRNLSNDAISWNVPKRPGRNIVGGGYISGNYWGDYPGTDIDGDGIGDTDIPYGPGDAGPLVMDPLGPDTTPPVVTEVYGQEAMTGANFNGWYTISDDRRLYNVIVSTRIGLFSERDLDWDFQDLPERTLFDEDLFELSIYVPENTSILSILMEVTDYSGNTMEQCFKHSVRDIIHPWSIRSSYPEQAYSGSIFPVTFWAEDNVDVSEVNVRFSFTDHNLIVHDHDPDDIESISAFEDLSDRGSFKADIPVMESAHYLHFWAAIEDEEGNEHITDEVCIEVIDATEPVLELIEGAPFKEGARNEIEFMVLDNFGIDDTRLVLTMNSVETIIYEEDFYSEDDTLRTDFDIPPGVRSLRYKLQAWDFEGNSQVLIGTLPVFDRTPPTISDLTTTDPVTGEEFQLIMSITDENGIKSSLCEWRFDDGPTVNSTFFDVVRLGVVPSDAYVLHYTVRTTDLSGNVRKAMFQRVVVDGTEPTIRITQEAPFTSKTFSLDLECLDNRFLERYEVGYGFDNDDGYFIWAPTDDGDYCIDVPRSVRYLNVLVNAWDGSGNHALLSTKIFVEDGTAPSITDLRTEQISEKEVVVLVKAFDNRQVDSAWVELVFDGDGHSEVRMTGPKNGTFKTLIVMPSDKVSYRVFITDPSGNIAVSELQAFEGFEEDENDLKIPFFAIVSLLFLILLLVAVPIFFVIVRRSNVKLTETDLWKLGEAFSAHGMELVRSDADCYRTLGLRKDASDKDVKRAYRRLVKLYHPDMYYGKITEGHDELINRLTCAREILLDREKRMLLDIYLRQ